MDGSLLDIHLPTLKGVWFLLPLHLTPRETAQDSFYKFCPKERWKSTEDMHFLVSTTEHQTLWLCSAMWPLCANCKMRYWWLANKEGGWAACRSMFCITIWTEKDWGNLRLVKNEVLVAVLDNLFFCSHSSLPASPLLLWSVLFSACSLE